MPSSGSVKVQNPSFTESSPSDSELLSFGHRLAKPEKLQLLLLSDNGWVRSTTRLFYKPTLISDLFQSKCSRAAGAADQNGEEADERVHDRESHVPLCPPTRFVTIYTSKRTQTLRGAASVQSHRTRVMMTARQSRCTQGLSSDVSMTVSTTSQQNHYIPKRRVASCGVSTSTSKDQNG